MRLVQTIAAAAFLIMAPSARAAVTLPQCSAPSVCLSFGAPALQVGPEGITWFDGSMSTSAIAGASAPVGPAGGDLGGQYPNPSVASLPAISGAALTSLTGANVVGNIGGQAGSVAGGGVDFSTITTALAGKLSSTEAVPNSLVDLSTVTSALAGKQATGNYVTALTGGVTASGPGSAAATVVTNANLTGPVTSVGNATSIPGPVPPAAVDLSTVTTALALKANLAGATFTGASGITNAAFTATGAGGNIVSGSSVTASAFFGDGANLTGVTRSSCTVVPNSSFSNTAYGVALATVTITTRGNEVAISLTATGQNSSNTQTTSCGALVDGSTATLGAKALSSNRATTADVDRNLAYYYKISGLSAASHTFALACVVTGGTGLIVNDSSHLTQFCASEAP